MEKMGVCCRYIHSDVDTMERIEIIEDFQAGRFDLLIGVNLLREGLDMPQVSLVAILDADKEGFLRSHTALIQTAGRAARNLNGKVIMYADTITDSMKSTIDETNRRRQKQMEYNKEHGITPTQIIKNSHNILNRSDYYYQRDGESAPLADPVLLNMDRGNLEKSIAYTKRLMESAAADLDFISAAKYRDEMNALKQLLSKK